MSVSYEGKGREIPGQKEVDTYSEEKTMWPERQGQKSGSHKPRRSRDHRG